MWSALMQRAGLAVERTMDIGFRVQAGPDEYWGFLLKKAT
jgi:hypothetical protein